LALKLSADIVLGGYWESIATFFGINVLLAFSLYIPMSAGLPSLGQAGFMAIGAYTSAMLTKAGVPFALALAAGAIVAGIAGLLVGAPALRIRGIYVIILTLGFGEIVRVFFLNFAPTGGAAGLTGIAPLTSLPWVIVACVLAYLLAWRLRHARLGRAMIAVHEDDIAAEANGINLMQIKLTAFSLGALIAGVSGAFYAHQVLFIDPTQFDFGRSAEAFLYVVLGGPANPLGPIVGAGIVTLLPEFLRFVQEWRMTVFGALLVVAAIWRPDGLIRAVGLRAK
jgi:branched-chain amino acid transport system permease protein